MYVLKNALRCISRSLGRNILIGIIALVIAVSACIGLSIRQAAENARSTTLEGMSITASISYDRQSMMGNMMGGMGFPGGGGAMPDFGSMGGGGSRPGGNFMENMFDSAANYVTEIDAAVNLTVVLQMIGIGLLLTLVASAVSVMFVMRYDPLKILANRD